MDFVVVGATDLVINGCFVLDPDKLVVEVIEDVFLEELKDAVE